METAAAAAARGDGGLVPGPAVLGAALERAGALVAAVRDRCCGLFHRGGGAAGPFVTSAAAVVPMWKPRAR